MKFDMSDSLIRVVSVVRDMAMYRRCLEDNRYCKGLILFPFDNREFNNPIPVCYNMFLDEYDYAKESWFIFCHEDFEFQEDIIPLLGRFDKGSLHGVVGAARKGFAGFGMQVIYGNMTEINRDGSGGTWNPGQRVSGDVEVETFDCCCLIVHSSLVAKHRLRFDEKLLFDLYVEDFCAFAKVRHAIRSYVHPVKCCHHSGSKATRRLCRHLPYLKEKYPKEYFVGTLVYFGSLSWQKQLQDWIVNWYRKL